MGPEGMLLHLRSLERTKVRATGFALCLLIFAFTACLTNATGEHDPDYDYDPPKPGTYTLPVIKPAADGALSTPTTNPSTCATSHTARSPS